MSDYTELKTSEEVLTALSTLYFNLNELERVYYDMFINTTPMDVTLQRYNDLGVLETIKLANRAKDLHGSLTGEGSPTGVVESQVGNFYLDLLPPYTLYYKASGSDAYGWVPLWSCQNLQSGIDFLAPDGNGSRLTNLNVNKVTDGILSVSNGGTGVASITGLIKGTGTGAFTPAIPGVDYLDPSDGSSDLVGIIAYYPLTSVPSGWLLCNGAAISRVTYKKLYNALGTSYGAGDGSTTFNIPDLRDTFIKGWDTDLELNKEYQGRVGSHTHAYSGEVEYEAKHTHTRGTMDITGNFSMETANVKTSGCFYKGSSVKSKNSAPGGDKDSYMEFQASRNWTGSTSGGSSHNHTYSGTTQADAGLYSSEGEPQPRHRVLVPVIKY